MNYLAHALLAGASREHRLGGLLGDFVKGPLPAGLPPGVADGVRLHRAIDSFADRHPAFRSSRARVSAERRRYSGIMVDMFYDHFLAAQWGRYHVQPLREFTSSAYALLEQQRPLLPPRLAQLLPIMRREDWLASYADVAAIARALDRMAERRLRRPNTLSGSASELIAGYAGFAADFAQFFPDVQAFAAATAPGS